mmetsp:Transcript_21781/g.30705  ORF Transcript_21781/g.30705 Transcript_21781/m.30705 type:complete len:417 (+) Transcript_21781:208-1458(+)
MVIVRSSPNSRMAPKFEREHSTVRFLNYYDSRNHGSVLFQLYGSVWPDVLPYCFLNMSLMALLEYINAYQNIDLSIKPVGHSFMSLLLGFLLVSRVNTSLARMMDMRTHLNKVFKSCAQLVNMATMYTLTEQHLAAREWRQDIAYKSMLLIRVITAVLEHQNTSNLSWNCPQIDKEERKYLSKSLYLEREKMKTHFGTDFVPALRWGHAIRSEAEECLRVPNIIANRLQFTIMKEREVLTERLAVNEERDLLLFVDATLEAYASFVKHITTPFPFPLVQMARTFLLFYLFSVPFALLRSDDHPTYVAHILIVFVMTYGFIGMEYVSIALDDPFGDDDIDIDHRGHASMVYEDCYALIAEVDGPEFADRLRAKMDDRRGMVPNTESEDSPSHHEVNSLLRRGGLFDERTYYDPFPEG